MGRSCRLVAARVIIAVFSRGLFASSSPVMVSKISLLGPYTMAAIAAGGARSVALTAHLALVRAINPFRCISLAEGGRKSKKSCPLLHFLSRSSEERGPVRVGIQRCE